MSTQRIDRNEKRALLARFKAPTDLHLEVSGIVAEVVRPPLAWWVSVGEVPESLFNAAATAAQAGQAATAEALNMPDVFKLALKIARASFKWPKLTEEGKETADEDELDPGTLPLPDLSTILVWGMGSSGTVETTGGEVEASALNSFRQYADVSGGGAGVRDVQAASGG
jgi:hypothetical protein